MNAIAKTTCLSTWSASQRLKNYVSKKIIGTSKLVDLPIGHFADVNGNIVYRYQRDNGAVMYWFPPGIYVIEKHGHQQMQEAYRGYGVEKHPGIEDRGYFCDPIEKPHKKHVDQAINLLKKAMKDKQINGLTYVDNY